MSDFLLFCQQDPLPGEKESGKKSIKKSTVLDFHQ
jgi:hypothetical protein